MEITDFPEELQFEFLLDLPSQEIIHFCQINQEASKICASEVFWNLKLQRTSFSSEDYGFPKPQTIGIIRGTTPAIRYQILEQILDSEKEADYAAIGKGQIDLFKFFLSANPNLLERWARDQDYLAEVICEAASKRYYETLDILWTLIPDAKLKLSIYSGAIKETVRKWDSNGIFYLNRLVGLSNFKILDLIVENYNENLTEDNEFEAQKDLKFLDEMLDRLDGIVQEYVFHLFSEKNGEYDIGPVIEHLIENYPGQVDVAPLIREFLDR